MPKVLIITYYWPPCGGSSVLRWLKFTKYLREFGWEPVIYTPSNPEPQEYDPSLVQEIPPGVETITSPIREPYRLYKMLIGKKRHDHLGVALMSDKKHGIISKISLWIRSNFFIPDPRRGWVRPSVTLLSAYLKNHPVDAIITTGPPHSMHLIGLGLKSKHDLKWIADFRDPWTNIDFYKDLPMTRFADHIQKKLESTVLKRADHIITVSSGMTLDFVTMGVSNITTITNGYDIEPAGAPDTTNSNENFILLHLGSLPRSRNPIKLWQVLSQLVQEYERIASILEIRLIGQVDISVLESIRNHGLLKNVVHLPYMAHHQTFSQLTSASALLLCINNTPNAQGILTNKFFEYLSARRPILAIGPEDGDASAILTETGAGRIFGYEDSNELKGYVLGLFELYSQHNLNMNSRHIEKYSRFNLTRELAELLNKVTA